MQRRRCRSGRGENDIGPKRDKLSCKSVRALVIGVRPALFDAGFPAQSRKFVDERIEEGSVFRIVVG